MVSAFLRKNSTFSVMSPPATSGPQEWPSRPCYAHIREVLNNVFLVFRRKYFMNLDFLQKISLFIKNIIFGENLLFDNIAKYLLKPME